jgi:hypothetical protein
VLGLAPLSWMILAVPAVAWLWGLRRVITPPGFGVWVLFVGWMLISASQLAQRDDLRSFSARAGFYVAAGVWLVYVTNLPQHHVERLAKALFWFFGFAVLAGLAGMVLSVTDFVTPVERALPASLRSIEFLRQMVHAQVVQVHDFLGFAVNRPAAPFAFTNEWGAALGILAPIALYAARTASAGWRRTGARVFLVISLIPVVYSLNRGLWVSIAAAIMYVAARLAVHGRARPLLNVMAALVVLGVLVVVTPLGTLAAERLDNGHSDERRGSLVQESVATAAEMPILGHGGPVINAEEPGRAPIGTHGQIWLLLVSHGVVGAGLYVGALLLMLVKSRHAPPDSIGFWANAAVFVALVQLPFYSQIPVQLQLVMVAAALALRSTGRDPARPVASTAE